MSARQVTVGVSILPTATTHIWSNGINQNIAFLAMLLQRLPFVRKVLLLNCGDVEELPATLEFDALGLQLVRPRDVTHDVDFVIEMGGVLPLEWTLHVRALGVPVVSLLVGHSYSAQAELPIFARQGTAFTLTPVDEIWTLANSVRTSAAMLRTVKRVPVHAVPHVWSPYFLDRQAAALAGRGARFGYEPLQRRSAGWRVGIFEPNISVVKCCFIPMLACDHAYRLRREAVNLMMVMNTFHMKEHPTFNRFASHLDLTRDGKASYEPRIAFAECMALNGLDAVVTHQWENELNYLLYDALHGGYPLVHNADSLRARGVGFHYADFDAEAAGEALLGAWLQEDGYWEDYRRRAREFLQTLAPGHEHNLAAFAARMQHLLEAPHARA